MNILLLGHREIASNLALSLIAAELPRHRFRVMLSADSGRQTGVPQSLAALATFEQRLCDRLRSEGSLRQSGVMSFEEIAGGGLRTLPQPNSPEGLQALADAAPDIVVSVRYRRILKGAAIAVPRHGVLNLHSGLLPAYRGMMATFWAMLNGESNIGSTLHYIVDGGIDTGPIVARAPLAPDSRRSYLANVLDLYRPGCAMVVDAVRRIDVGKPVAHVAQEEGGHYYSMPGAEDVARFERAGLRLFDGDELERWQLRSGG